MLRRCAVLRRRSIFTTAVERVEHITLLRAAHVPDRKDADEMQDRLARVPGVISASVGASSSSAAPAYNVALVVRVLDDDALSAFRDHPDVAAVHESLGALQPEPQEGQDSSSRMEVSFKFTHNAVLRPLPALVLGGVCGGVGGLGVGLLM